MHIKAGTAAKDKQYLLITDHEQEDSNESVTPKKAAPL
jgi:hypothetical protein